MTLRLIIHPRVELPQVIETGVPGATLFRLLPEHVARDYFDKLMKEEWSHELVRDVIHYFYTYNYRDLNEMPKKGPKPPQYIQDLTNVIYSMKLWGKMPSQIITNKYLPGQGIAPHVDHKRFFQDEISTLSLGSGIIMEFRQTVEPFRQVECYLPVGYILIMRGDARYGYTHGISKRKTDVINGQTVERGTRISITWRSLRQDYKDFIDAQ